MKESKMKTKTVLKVSGIIGFLEGVVTPIGNGAKVGCPKEFIGKHVYLVFFED
jgi:putative transposon-encoded protein